METRKTTALSIRQLPNCITALRIVGTVGLLFAEPFTAAFYVIYSLCGLSDILDGWIARKFGLVSDFGSKLDSAADLLYCTVMGIRIFPVLWSVLPWQVWTEAWTAIGLRVCSYIVAAVRYRRFSALHTYLNKATGFSVFIIPYFILTPVAIPVCAVVGVVSISSSLEELLMHLTSKEYNPKRRTLIAPLSKKKA